MYRLVAALCLLSVTAAADPTPEDAASALRRGVEYFRSEVALEGGYLWRYAADFSLRDGETPASPATVWVQPPGTPAVGLAYLTVYELTGDPYYLEAATETAHALVRGQLRSGGWHYRIEFDPAERAKFAYRTNPDGGKDGFNTTTLDDDTTQAALRCLMRVDRALDFKDATIHEAVQYALHKLIEAQYPNGAWPQRYSAPPDPAKHPVKAASYPEDWPKTFPNVRYEDFYTFNDNTHSDVIGIMFLAAEIYNDDTFAAAGRKGGDFMILAQMPDPQPGWAQQYNAEMHPAWARKFEPASITGNESQGVMDTLLRIFEITGERKYLEPLPRAIAYYRTCLLDDGRLARFYELKTNTPLYFTKDYQVTYSDADMPTHYSFKSGSRLDAIEAEYQRLAAIPESEWKPRPLVIPAEAPAASEAITAQCVAIIEAQSESGAWIAPASKTSQGGIPSGIPALDVSTFNKNIVALAQFIAAK